MALPPTTKSDMFAIGPDTDPADKIIFFKRVRASIIGQRIYNSLSPTSLASLKFKEHLYFWKTHDGDDFYDGVTMLQILVEKVKPSTRVGIFALKDKIRATRSVNSKHNIGGMLDHINDTYYDIVRSVGNYKEMIMNIFNSLLPLYDAV